MKVEFKTKAEWGPGEEITADAARSMIGQTCPLTFDGVTIGEAAITDAYVEGTWRGNVPGLVLQIEVDLPKGRFRSGGFQ